MRSLAQLDADVRQTRLLVESRHTEGMAEISRLQQAVNAAASAGTVVQGTRGARPSTGRRGETYYESDTGWLYAYDRTGWVYVAGILVAASSVRTTPSAPLAGSDAVGAADEGALFYESDRGWMYRWTGTLWQFAWGGLYRVADEASLPVVSVADEGAFSYTLDKKVLWSVVGGVWTKDTIGAVGGGTGQEAYTLGDLLYASATDALSKLAGNTAATRKFLRQLGDGTASAAPDWDTLQAADIPNLDAAKTTTGVFDAARIPANGGASGTVTLLKLTGGGADGSLTFVDGIVTAFTAPT